ncbi:MAG TPA: ankyrin repeat domain-containing protein [Rhodocyclaceae bacterium]|nr:ankyrin repeat domain-containing protein [Rhodocyclaceae bacterium]
MACFALVGCQSTKQIVPRLPPPVPVPTFSCDTTAQEIMCSDEALARLDKELATIYHHQLRHSDSIGRDLLVAEQKRWLIGRATACQVPTLRLDYAAPPNPALVSCLIKVYAERIVALKQWPQNSYAPPASTKGSLTPYRLSAYVEFRQADDHEPQLCAALADAFNGVLRSRGDLDIPHIPGMSELAGTHGEEGANATHTDAPKFFVELRDAGPYAGYALRAGALKSSDGRTLLDEAALGNWIRSLPNHGGRPNSAASQTGDYGSVDVFRYSDRTLTLLAEPWGQYSPGAQGEWAFSGVYQITSAGTVEPLCLYRTYMRPPLKNGFERLPTYNALLALLSRIHGTPSGELVGGDLHAEHLLHLESQWQIQNMPLLGLDDVQRHGWSGWLRLRHDAVLDALFSWSERSLRNKTAYRHLLTLLPAAVEEVSDIYQRTQRLTADDAREAANLAVMRVLAYDVSDLSGNVVTLPDTLVAAMKYRAKYPIVASESDIQRDRAYSGLYSAALNGAEKEVIDDLIKYEYANGKSRQTHGADGETALMAAVESPEIVQQLLAAGAGVNEVDTQGRTPLINAAEIGQPESIRLLLAAGAQVAARSKASDEAPLGMSACQSIKADLPPEDRIVLQKMLCTGAGIAAP